MEATEPVSQVLKPAEYAAGLAWIQQVKLLAHLTNKGFVVCVNPTEQQQQQQREDSMVTAWLEAESLM